MARRSSFWPSETGREEVCGLLACRCGRSRNLSPCLSLARTPSTTRKEKAGSISPIPGRLSVSLCHRRFVSEGDDEIEEIRTSDEAEKMNMESLWGRLINLQPFAPPALNLPRDSSKVGINKEPIHVACGKRTTT